MIFRIAIVCIQSPIFPFIIISPNSFFIYKNKVSSTPKLKTMIIKKTLVFILLVSIAIGCKRESTAPISKLSTPFKWENATVYFMLTDRFFNGDKSNDFVHPDSAAPAPYRGFMGGDVKGITQKIKDGYFDKLGVNAIWMTPLFENNIGSVDEGTGRSYGFHGYWIKDWTSYDKRIGTKEDIKEMVTTAHAHGIRVLFDVVANHTGPVTPQDTKWPDDWVKTGPRCVYKDAETTINCTLVENLPDIRTESKKDVALPPHIVAKWKAEGRYDQEVKELDEFFTATKYPRRPYFYIIKWLVDLIKEFGIDGFRVDTAKHTETEVWRDLAIEAEKAFAQWKKENPSQVLDDNKFYMVGEVYNYFIGNGRLYDYNDKKVDFFSNGLPSLINFDFKGDANKSYDSIFTKYDTLLAGPLSGATVLNYISSHDDGGPFDKERKRTFESATKLLLTQGGAQIYYGDESGRSLSVQAEGDAVLRSFMNWDEMDKNKDLLAHWQKLGTFRKNHPSIGAGRHKKVTDMPYTFERSYTSGTYADKVVIALDVDKKSDINVSSLAQSGKVKDGYSGKSFDVNDGKVAVEAGKVYLFEKM
jgi:alpha-amylase